MQVEMGLKDADYADLAEKEATHYINFTEMGYMPQISQMTDSKEARSCNC